MLCVAGNKGSVLNDPNGNLILSGAASCVNRVNTTLFISKQQGKPGSFTYRQHIDEAGGYSTLAMADHNTIALLYEQEWTIDKSASGLPAGSHAVHAEGGIRLARVQVDQVANRGTIPCADAFCPTAHPPPPPDQVNASVGYCRPKT